MRVYGRNPEGQWIVVTTDANGSNDICYAVALAQILSLVKGESPFFGQSGIPTQQAIQQQVAPSYYVQLIQQQYAQFFASLTITQVLANPPSYSVVIITHAGTILNVSVTVPT